MARCSCCTTCWRSTRASSRSSSSSTRRSARPWSPACARTRRRCAAAPSRVRSTATGSRPRSSNVCAARSTGARAASPDARTRRFHRLADMPRLSQLFAPREREFFDLFEEAGSNIVRAAELLERMLDHWPDHGEIGRDVVVCEQEGDRITHDIIQRLNSTFVTPIDREDIYALASGMDDIVDFIEEVADFLALYRIE